MRKHIWFNALRSICLLVSSGVPSGPKSQINVSGLDEVQLHNSLAESFLKFYTYLTLILSYVLCIWLADWKCLFCLLIYLLFPQNFPGECVENCFSCSQKG